MMNKNKKRNIIIGTAITTTLAAIPTSYYFVSEKIAKDNKAKEINTFVEKKLNNYNQPQKNNSFVKGVDVSSYCELIENFLFQNNIKKADGSWYKYDEIFTNNYNGQTIYEYVNNNFFSYYDENGNRIYDNMFAILKRYGTNSIRLRVWVDPYDENGKSYGGGHNDLNTTLNIVREAKKYGFNSFKIDLHYSDFWADPNRQSRPKSWNDLTEEQLTSKIYEYTQSTINSVLNEIEENDKLIVQIGNEIDNGILWKINYNNTFSKTSIEQSVIYLDSAIQAVKDLNIKNIKLGLGFGGFGNVTTFKERFSSVIEEVDNIYLSFYPNMSKDPQDNIYFQLIRKIQLYKEFFPNQNIYLGEFSLPFKSREEYLINTNNALSIGNTKISDGSPVSQFKLLYDCMNVLSNILPNEETGLYWWEPAFLAEGRLSWTTKEGIKHLLPYESLGEYISNFKDINNNSSMTMFDTNAIVLPSLYAYDFFERNANLEKNNVIKASEICSTINDSEIINSKAQILVNKNFNKIDLQNALYEDYSNIKYTSNKILNLYIDNIKNEKDFENEITNLLKKYYSSLSLDQIEYSDFNFDKTSRIGSVKLVAKKKSFLYKGSITISFKINDYISTTIDLQNSPITIKANDNQWYSQIIAYLKSLPNWQFDNDIYNHLHIKGGANDDNAIWLWDEQKGVSRNAEFFLLKNDKIMNQNSSVEFDLLNQNKVWVDKLEDRYSKGEHEIYFAIKKGLNDLNLEWDIDSTFSQIGLESWKDVDILVYKVKVKII